MNKIDGTDRTHVIVMNGVQFKRLFTERDARLLCAYYSEMQRETPSPHRRKFHWKRIKWDY